MSASLPQPLMTYQTIDDSLGQGEDALLNDSDWAGIDTGSLSWLIPEIREAFAQSLQSLTAFSQTPEDTTALRLARSHLHQAHGALQVVDLDGVALMTEEVEHLFELFESRPARCDADAVAVIGAAFHGVIEYLEELMAGQPHQPVRMFDAYAALLKLKGADRIHPSDLFFPDLSIRPPLSLTETRTLNPLEITQQRARFERGLLGYLRNESDPAALSEMAAAVATIEASSKQGQQRAFWWITRGFFEALQNRAIPQDAEIKKLVARINLQIRRLLDDSATIAERVLRDALYFVARARPVTEHIRDVQQVYRLARALPQDFGVKRAVRVDAAKIRQVKDLLAGAKKSWGAIVAGNVARIPDFARDSSAVLELSGNFGQAGLAQLALVIANIGTDLSFDPRRPSEQVGLDVASALLFLESVVEQINSLDSSFNARALQLVARLDAAAAGIVAEEQIPWLDELASRAHERQTMGQFIVEIQGNLQTVEKTLDAYFRDTSQREGLVAAEGLLAQAGGALAVMGHDQAAKAIAHSRKSMLCFAEEKFVPDAAEFERIAHTLGAVGFYVEQLQNGAGKGTVFRFDERTGQFTAEIGIAFEQKPAEVSAPAASPAISDAATLEQETARRAGDVSQLMDSLRENPDDEMARDLLLTNLEQVHENAILLDDRDLRENAAEAIKLLHANENDDTLENALNNTATDGLADRITELANQSSRLAGQEAPLLPVEPATPVPLEDDEEKIDAELLEIFLGEAQEVLETAQQTLNGLKEYPASHDYLVTMRRAFHTLKGSGRMVGLYEFGDAAWGIEQTLNQQVSAATPVMPNLLHLLSTATVEMEAWVKELANQGVSSRRAQALVDHAAAVREGRPYEAPAAHAHPELMHPESVTQHPDPLADVMLAFEGAPVESAPEPLVEMDAGQEILPQDWMAAPPGLLLDEKPPVTTVAGEAELPVEFYLPDDADQGGESNRIGKGDDLTLDFTGSVHGPNPTNLEAVFQNLAPEFKTRAELDIEPSRLSGSEGPYAPHDASNEAPLAEPHLEGVSGTPVETPVKPGFAEITTPQNAAPDAAPNVAPEESATVLPFPSSEPPPAYGDNLCRIGHLTIAQPLYNIFLVEADELLRTVARDFSEWRHEPERCGSEAAFRAVHSLAGSSSTVGLSAVHDLARAIEAVLLTSAQQAAPVEAAELDLLDSAVESLRAMLHQFAAQFLPDENPERIEELNALRHKLAAWQADFEAPTDGPESAGLEELPTEVEMLLAAPDGAVIEAAGLDAQFNAEFKAEVDPEFNASADEFAFGEAAPALPIATPQLAPVPEPGTTVPALASITAALHASHVRDDIDPELMEIFIQEANDYMPQIGQNLREWQADPSRFEITLALQRQLHTVKGSARMAGAMRLGELIHEMETRVETGATLSQIPQGFFDELLSAHDHGLELLNLLAHPASARAAHFQESMRESGSVEEDHAPVPVQPLVDRRATARPSNQTTPMVRVRADVLDRLVNQAGEVSISRARLDNEIGQIRTSLNDLTDNLARLRGQLREIEIQGETQMQSQLSMAREKEHFDPLEFDRFTRFQELTRMMAESVEDIELVRKTLVRSLEGAGRNLSIQQRMTRDMQQDLMHVRMVPFSSVAERLYRVVRQAAKELDKRANLDIRGATVEIDRALLEQMVAPFEHLLRNAVVHGIESREERRAAGKEEIGELLVEARHEGNEIVLTFSDDGSGLNLARIRERAIAVGLIGEQETLTDQRAADLIFQPGFTTATHVTELAGRGVGMDVVREEAAALGGRVTVESQAGKGTRFTVHLPLTLAVTQAVVLRSAGRLFALPAVLVEAVQQVKDEPLAQAYVEGHFDWQGKPIGLHFLSRLLGEDAAPLAQRYSPVLILRSGGVHIALHVDEVVGNQEAVVKNVGPQLARMTGVAGATVLGSGEVVLILNPVQIAQRRQSIELNQAEKNQRQAQVQPQAPVQAVEEAGSEGAPLESASDEAETPASLQNGETAAESFTHPVAAYVPTPPPASEKASRAIGTLPLVMVVDDSLTVRRVTQRLLMREGYQVVLAKDGVDALQQMQDFKPDVMLVDIEMPRMDGFDLTRNIRADERYRNIPIIMITSRTADKHRSFAMELGVNVYLGKPYQDDELLANIGAFTGKLAAG